MHCRLVCYGHPSRCLEQPRVAWVLLGAEEGPARSLTGASVTAPSGLAPPGLKP